MSNKTDSRIATDFQFENSSSIQLFSVGKPTAPVAIRQQYNYTPRFMEISIACAYILSLYTIT